MKNLLLITCLFMSMNSQSILLERNIEGVYNSESKPKVDIKVLNKVRLHPIAIQSDDYNGSSIIYTFNNNLSENLRDELHLLKVKKEYSGSVTYLRDKQILNKNKQGELGNSSNKEK